MLPRLTAAVILLAGLPCAQGAAPVMDDWMVMRAGKSDLGYVHSVTREIRRDGKPLFETRVETVMSMKRLGATVGIEQSSISLERPDGSLVEIEFTMTMSNQESSARVTFEDAVDSMMAAKKRVVESGGEILYGGDLLEDGRCRRPLRWRRSRRWTRRR